MFPKPKTLTFISELAAEKAISKSLFREIKRLKGEQPMSKVIKSTDGKYYLAHDYQEITADQVTGEIAELQNELKELEAIAPASDVAPAAQPEQPTVPETPAADPAPAQPETPAVPAEAQPAEAAPAEPAQPPVNPVDQLPAENAQPANDGASLTLQ